MSLLRRIPLNYLIYVPSVYFALLGTYDIVSDILNGGIKAENLFFNLIFFLPLAIRRWYIPFGFGLIFGVFWIWLLITGSFLMMDKGVLAEKPLAAIGLWLFLLASVLCSVMLFHAGSRLKASLGITHRLNP